MLHEAQSAQATEHAKLQEMEGQRAQLLRRKEEMDEEHAEERDRLQAAIDDHVDRWKALENTALRVQEEGSKEVVKLLQERIAILESENQVAKQVTSRFNCLCHVNCVAPCI